MKKLTFFAPLLSSFTVLFRTKSALPFLCFVFLCISLSASAETQLAEAYPEEACADDISFSVPYAVIKYAYAEAISKRPNPETFFDYKNSKRRAPRHFDLLDAKLSQVSQPLVNWYSQNKRYWASTKPTRYEQKVLELKAGDFVQFGDVTFQLGKFLGSGNATHIFEIVDSPDKVIRIPFLADYFISRRSRVGDSQEDRLNGIRRSIKAFVEKIKEKKQRLRIYGTGREFAYAVVERIHGDEDGYTFLDRLLATTSKPFDPVFYTPNNRSQHQPVFYPDRFRGLDVPQKDIAKLTALVEAMTKNNEIGMDYCRR